MATENDAVGNGDTHQPSASNETEDMNAEDKGKGEEKPNSVPFHNIFSFCEFHLLMVIGTVVAVRNGLGMSLTTILFGWSINSFGKTSQADVVGVLSKLCLKFFYLAVGTGLPHFFMSIACVGRF